MQVVVVGAGVAGLTCAVELAEQGVAVELLERADVPGPQSCSWHAGGMLAPWCERERTEPIVSTYGEQSLQWWCQRYPQTVRFGTLVVAHGRDAGELTRLAQRTENFQWLDAQQVGRVEPDLAGRFDRALLFPEEAHLEPRAALQFLAARLEQLGGVIRYGVDGRRAFAHAGPIIDCTGLGARDVLTDLRGVRGEALVVGSAEINLHRPVRLLHPRTPVYVVPRGQGVYMIGATMIESDERRGVTVRSALELLGAACGLHPAFGEAELLETGAQVRPAFPDNLPRITRRDQTIYVNGLYRHGFLVAPALARIVAHSLLNNPLGTIDEGQRERQYA